jgi:glucosamine kinase
VTNTENPHALPAGPLTPPPNAPRGVVIGLDIGGTKTHGIRFVDGIPVADESAGSSNVQNVTREEAAQNLARSRWCTIRGCCSLPAMPAPGSQ